VVPTQQVMDAFRDLLRAELTALCVALQGHLDELFRRQESLGRAVLALSRRLDALLHRLDETAADDGTAASDDKAVGESQAKLARRKAGPRQRRVTSE
jgi:hypothetical protein